MAFERRWWSWIALAALAAIPAVLFVGWYVANVLPLDLQGGVAAVTDALLALDIVIVLLGLAFYMVVKAVLARRRAMRLGAALDGVPDALPLARIPDDQTADSEGLDSVVARWPRARLTVAGQVAGFLFFGALTCFMLTAPTFFVLVAFRGPGDVDVIDTALLFSDRALLFSLMLAFGGPVLVLLPLLADMLANVIQAPARIEVDMEGLRWHGVWGARRYIGWNEARLIEANTYTTSQSGGRPSRQALRYILYGRESRIAWAAPLTQSGQPLQAFKQVLSIVIGRTGLQVRTLDPKLLAPDQFMSVSALQCIDTHFARTLVAGAFGLGILGLGVSGPELLIGEGIFLGFVAVVAFIGKPGKRAAQHQGSAVPNESEP